MAAEHDRTGTHQGGQVHVTPRPCQFRDGPAYAGSLDRKIFSTESKVRHVLSRYLFHKIVHAGIRGVSSKIDTIDTSEGAVR
jgi:hypothetical protein